MVRREGEVLDSVERKAFDYKLTMSSNALVWYPG